MFARQAIASALHLFVILAFLVGGFFFIALPFLPEIKAEIFEKSTLIGTTLLIVSVLLLLGFYALDRGRYLVIQMGVSVDLPILRQTVDECLTRHFGKKIALSDVEIGAKSRVGIRVSLAPLNEEEREDLFIEAEKQLSLLLKDRFGYIKPFYLLVQL